MSTDTAGLVGLYVPASSMLDAGVECRVTSRLELVDAVVGDLVTFELLESRSATDYLTKS